MRMTKERPYIVFCIIHRNATEYPCMITTNAHNAMEAKENLERMFGWNCPHPFYIKAFRKEGLTAKAILDYYQRPWMGKAEWYWNPVTQKPFMLKGGSINERF